MFTVGDYIYIESIDELSGLLRDGDSSVLVIGLGIFHDVTNVNYPHAFKYHDSPDTHCCGDWYPCLNQDMISSVDKMIDYHKREIEDLRNIRKTLKENI